MNKFLLDNKFTTEEQLHLLSEVINTSIEGIGVYKAIRGQDGRIIDFSTLLVNKSSLKILNKTEEELHSGTVRERHPGIENTDLFKFYITVIENNTTNRLEVHYGGVWYDLAISRLGDGMLVNYLDITARKESELKTLGYSEEIDKKNNELKAINNNLKQFAYAASHDLQEPLRKIATFIDMIEQDKENQLNTFSLNLIQKLKDSANRMAGLIRNLLNYSHLTNGSETNVNVNLNDLFIDICSDLELTIKESNTSLTIGKLPTIKGSKHQLNQLFQNLLTNAIKFRKSNTNHRVDITYKKVNADNVMCHLLDKAKTYVQIDVTDNGIGFDEKYKETIFEVFTKLHSKNEYTGSGIGLALCHRVCVTHKGCIDVSSKVGEGTTFSVYLPIR